MDKIIRPGLYPAPDKYQREGVKMPTMYQSVKRSREEYKDLEVKVDEIYKIGVTNRVYPKSCYDKSWDYMAHSICKSKIKLVHGSCIALKNIRIDHAWIEFIDENIIFEGVYQRFYDRDKYYKARDLIKNIEYTAKEMNELSLKFEHKGPWLGKQNNCFDFGG